MPKYCLSACTPKHPKYFSIANEPTGYVVTKNTLESINIFSEINAKGNTVILITYEQDISA